MGGHPIVEELLAPDFATINLGYVALLVGAFLKSMNRVRALLAAASLCFILYGLSQGIWSMVVWNLTIGGLNLNRLVAASWSATQVWLTAEQESLRRQLFDDLSPSQFQQLWALGRDVLCADCLLVETGEVSDRLFLLLRGSVQIRRGDLVLATLGPGAVIGEPEPTPFSSPSADWLASGAVWLRCWDLDDLTRFPRHRRTLDVLARGGPIVEEVAA